MQTTNGKAVRFFHNGDFSGDVVIVRADTEEQMQVPFADLKALVAAWVVQTRIAALEQMTDDQVLLDCPEAVAGEAGEVLRTSVAATADN